MAKPRRENLHDKFFRETFAQPALLTDFLRNYLPPTLAEALDWRQPVEVRNDTFVDEELREHFSDLLCRVNLKEGAALFVYVLIEHKSRPAPWVAL